MTITRAMLEKHVWYIMYYGLDEVQAEEAWNTIKLLSKRSK